MKETIVSQAEREFLLKGLSERRRLDGRAFDEFRDLKIHFGREWGCCLVTLGETKILAQVSCEVQQPKPTRPTEGLLLMYVELSPMAAPHFEAGRQSDLGVLLNRLLEKCIKDSRCLDLESLCITAEEKVWAIRVDVNVLNHEGNLVDAASIAALTALAHFRRPDVTTTGEETIIHDPAERDPIPITLHHHPVCVSFGIFDAGNFILADPTLLEERVSEGQIVYGVNAYRELCGLHLEGKGQVTTDLVLQCATKASKRALDVVNQIKKSLEDDLNARNSGESVGFRELIESGDLLSLRRDCFSIQLNSKGLREGAMRLARGRKVKKQTEPEFFGPSSSESEYEEEDEVEEKPVVFPLENGSAELVDEKQHVVERKKKMDNQVEGESESSEEMEEGAKQQELNSDADDVEVVAQFDAEHRPSKVIDSIDLIGDSEEEETVVLQAEELNQSTRDDAAKRKTKEKKNMERGAAISTSRGWYTKSQW